MTLEDAQTKTGRPVLTLEAAQARIDAVAPYITVLEYVPSKFGKSRFRDERRDVEFEYFFFPLVSYCRKVPGYLPSQVASEKKSNYARRTAKSKATWTAKYGVSNPSLVPEIRAKQDATIRARYGASCSLQHSDIRAKSMQTLRTNYGVDNPMQHESVRAKVMATCADRYTNGHPLKDPVVRDKQIATAIKNGTVHVVGGARLRDIAATKGLHYQTVVQRYADFGPEGLVEPRTETGIEGLMRRALLEWGVEFVQSRQLQGTTHRPDFYLPSYNLAIECDGLYWHSDHVVDKKYHLRRQEDFAAVGVSSLFFREDELLSSFDVVKSIVRNRLGLCSRKIGARKCRVTQDVPVSFFKDNHLMGAGAGRTYGLEYKGEVVAAVQVSWYRKHARVLDISRFCTAKDTSVAGGFSKLLASLILAEQPSLVRSFVDQRYGTGAHLASLGFTPGKKHLSFRWAKGRKTLHRLVFPSNSGYTNGWCKLWDCGQVLWTKEL